MLTPYRLKNAPDLVPALAAQFDFSLVEECWDYQECEKYYEFILLNKPVFVVIYDKGIINDEKQWRNLCDNLLAYDYFVLGLPLQLNGKWVKNC
jgi:hypothetical protein